MSHVKTIISTTLFAVFLMGDAARAIYSTYALYEEVSPALTIFAASLLSFLVTITLNLISSKNTDKTPCTTTLFLAKCFHLYQLGFWLSGYLLYCSGGHVQFCRFNWTNTVPRVFQKNGIYTGVVYSDSHSGDIRYLFRNEFCRDHTSQQ